MKFELTKYNILFAVALLFAVWFAITSWAWGYLANLFISFPFGLISLLLVIVGKNYDPEKERYTIVNYVLAGGAIFSLIVLFLFLG